MKENTRKWINIRDVPLHVGSHILVIYLFLWIAPLFRYAIPFPHEIPLALIEQDFAKGYYGIWIAQNVGVTLFDALTGYVLGNGVAIALAFLIALVPRIERIVIPDAIALKSIPWVVLVTHLPADPSPGTNLENKGGRRGTGELLPNPNQRSYRVTGSGLRSLGLLLHATRNEPLDSVVVCASLLCDPFCICLPQSGSGKCDYIRRRRRGDGCQRRSWLDALCLSVPLSNGSTVRTCHFHGPHGLLVHEYRGDVGKILLKETKRKWTQLNST